MRSNYDYELIEVNGRNVMLIVDLCLGGKSVTNDIENVVADISARHQINPANYLIIYKDSEAVWDGWDHVTQSFVALRKTSFEEAIHEYIRLQLQPVKQKVMAIIGKGKWGNPAADLCKN